MNTNHQQYSAQYGLQADKISFKVTGYYNKFHRNWYKLDKVKGEGKEELSLIKVLSDPSRYSRAYEALKGTIDADEALSIKANNREYQAYGLQPILGLRFGSTDALQHQIEASLRYHYDEIDRFQKKDSYDMRNGRPQLAVEREFGTESNRIISATTLSGYLRYNLQIGKQLLITPGLRYESISLLREDYGKEDPNRSGDNLKTREVTANVLIPGTGRKLFL